MVQIKVIWGPPAAGKSTYVEKHKGDNDLIFDFDLLMRDLSGLDIYDRNENLISYLVNFRQQIIDTLETEEQLNTAWVIISFPEDELKEQLENLSAEFVLIYEPEKTCKERIENDDQRKDKEEWKRIVEEWFEKYKQAETKAVTRVPKTKHKKFWNFKVLGEKTGELTLYGEISNYSWWGDEVTPKQFKDDLNALGDIDTLNVFINSPGGDVFAGQAIYSILRRCDAQVKVYVDGLAASIASLIAMAGDKVIMPKNAMMMIHSPWTVAVGNAQEFRKIADDMDKIRDSMVTAYESRSALTKEEILEMLDAETWLSAEDCFEYGFADEIEDEKQVAACLDKEVLGRYKNTPEGLLANEPEPEPDDDPGPDPDEEVKARELQKKILALELELI